MRSRCRRCSSRYSQEYRRKNGRKSRDRWENLKYRYGITRERYEEILKSQGGRCATCGREDSGAEGKQFCVDHDHTCCPVKTRTCGKCVRGLLCFQCNIALGYVGDDPQVLKNMIEYLKRGGNSG